MREKIYISGPISGMPNRNEASFMAAQDFLFDHGFDAENPMNNPYPHFLTDDGEVWQYQMRKAVAQLVSCCGIMMLPGWENSKGATIELWIALMFGLIVYDECLNAIEIDPEEITLPSWQDVKEKLGLV